MNHNTLNICVRVFVKRYFSLVYIHRSRIAASYDNCFLRNGPDSFLQCWIIVHSHQQRKSLPVSPLPNLHLSVSFFLFFFFLKLIIAFLLAVTWHFVCVCVCVCVCLFRASPAAYGSSQARGQMGAIAGGQRHSHSNARSEPCL